MTAVKEVTESIGVLVQISTSGGIVFIVRTCGCREKCLKEWQLYYQQILISCSHFVCFLFVCGVIILSGERGTDQKCPLVMPVMRSVF